MLSRLSMSSRKFNISLYIYMCVCVCVCAYTHFTEEGNSMNPSIGIKWLLVIEAMPTIALLTLC